MKQAIELMKKAIAMMEAGSGEMSEEHQEPKEDGTSSSIGNSESGGEANDLEDRKQKKNMVIAAMKRKQF